MVDAGEIELKNFFTVLQRNRILMLKINIVVAHVTYIFNINFVLDAEISNRDIPLRVSIHIFSLENVKVA